MQDLEVLIVICLGWVALLVAAIYQQVIRFRAHGGAAVPPRTYSKFLSGPRAFQEALGISKSMDTRKSKRSNKTVISAVTQHSELQRTHDYKRSSTYMHIFHATPSKIWKTVFSIGLLSLTMAWIVTNGLHDDWFRLEVTLFLHLEVAVKAYAVLMPLACCLLALHVHHQLARFSSLIDHIWQMQDSLEEIALVVGSTLGHQRHFGEVSDALCSLHRYLNLVHVLAYYQVSSHFRFELDDVKRADVITQEEFVHLRTAVDGLGMALAWTSQIVTQLLDTKVMDASLAGLALGLVRRLRRATSALMQEVRRLPPLSLAQLLQLLVDVACLFTPPVLFFDFLAGPTHDAYVTAQSQLDGRRTGGDGVRELFISGGGAAGAISSISSLTANPELASAAYSDAEVLLRKSRVHFYVWPMVASMLIATFLQATVAIVNDLDDPFGLGLDHLDPDHALCASELRIGDRLLQDPSDKLVSELRLAAGADFFSPVQPASEPSGMAAVAQLLATEGPIDEPARPPPLPPPEDDPEDDEARSDASSSEASAPRRPPRPNITGPLPRLPTSVSFDDQTMQRMEEVGERHMQELRKRALDVMAVATAVSGQITEEDRVTQAAMDLLVQLKAASLENASLRELLVAASSSAEGGALAARSGALAQFSQDGRWA